MINRFILYIGLNDKDTKQQEINTIDAYKIIQSIVGDSTISESKGIYTHENGTQVLENTLVVSILDFANDKDVNSIVQLLKTALNQESIAVIKDSVDSTLM